MEHRPVDRIERLLREFVREALVEGPAGPGVTADPSPGARGGARDYELERGADIHGYWYRSPGDRATGGDPGRPEDAREYIGMSDLEAAPTDDETV